jgi:hypothetical protein
MSIFLISSIFNSFFKKCWRFYPPAHKERTQTAKDYEFNDLNGPLIFVTPATHVPASTSFTLEYRSLGLGTLISPSPAAVNVGISVVVVRMLKCCD